jgi:hypothetical protein
MLKQFVTESYKENKVGTLDECCEEVCKILKTIGFTNINDMMFEKIKDQVLSETDGEISELTFHAGEHDAPHVLAFFYSPFELIVRHTEKNGNGPVVHQSFYIVGNAIGSISDDYKLALCRFNYNLEEKQAWITYWC